MESRRSTLALAILTAAFALLIAIPGAIGLFTPDSDGLFCEVQKLEIEGHGTAELVFLPVCAIGLAILGQRLLFGGPILRPAPLRPGTDIRD